MRQTIVDSGDPSERCPACHKRVDAGAGGADARCRYCGRALWFVTSERPGSVVMARVVRARITDAAEVIEFGNALGRLADGRSRVVLDFSGVQALSSAALGKIVSLQTQLAGAGGALRLCGFRPEILHVFRITNLDKVLTILPDQKAALDGFGK